ncbi:hypothetical protein PoB_006683900 [Plakobranchus ocellatus]|uniref:Uncharacterized protein n=1 Tax=Plakobranchus ocellatus TaxID=259542 RepID=A0AAV4D855_9GAST|nr:hypothetical protein PoB_006683900 [Plakobranchus ocellatus]
MHNLTGEQKLYPPICEQSQYFVTGQTAVSCRHKLRNELDGQPARCCIFHRKRSISRSRWHRQCLSNNRAISLLDLYLRKETLVLIVYTCEKKLVLIAQS